jgi:hypothetical protein
MVVARIVSGLGNQLFQYASGYALARQRRTPLFLDTDFYNGQPSRRYELDRFCISGRPINSTQRLWVRISDTTPRGRRSALLRRIPCWRLTMVRDPLAGAAAKPLDAPNNSLLLGYWQNEAYFKHLRKEIIQEFSFKAPPNEQNSEMLARIAGNTSVCVHVRRGDYKNPGEVLAPLPPAYYKRAIEWVLGRHPGALFFVFSDEPEWARASLPLPDSTIFVSHNNGKNDPEDLRLMSACNHFIIANSTFSWWAAWLSASQGKSIVAPRRWFNVPRGEESGIVPTDWHRT